MAYPLPTHTTQKQGEPWTEVWRNIAWQTPIVLLCAAAGGVAGLIPTLFVWIYNGGTEVDVLLFWGKGGIALGLVIGGWICVHNSLDIWLEARGARVAVDSTPFEDAAWAAFRAWLDKDGHHKAHADGCTTLTFVAPWQVTNGDAVARYGPVFETKGTRIDGGYTSTTAWPKLAWVPSDVAVPNARARAAYRHQQSGYVAVRIGPFSVQTAHGVLALEGLRTPLGTKPEHSTGHNTPST
jgi:hypothetical protein